MLFFAAGRGLPPQELGHQSVNLLRLVLLRPVAAPGQHLDAQAVNVPLCTAQQLQAGGRDWVCGLVTGRQACMQACTQAGLRGTRGIRRRPHATHEYWVAGRRAGRRGGGQAWIAIAATCLLAHDEIVRRPQHQGGHRQPGLEAPACGSRWMGGWMDGWMDGWMHGQYWWPRAGKVPGRQEAGEVRL